jgi:signal transduction histidine kinase
VSLSYEPSALTVAVENQAGAPSAVDGAAPGVGIIGMTERASAIGGTLRAAPLSDGFRVDAELPYQRNGT